MPLIQVRSHGRIALIAIFDAAKIAPMRLGVLQKRDQVRHSNDRHRAADAVVVNGGHRGGPMTKPIINISEIEFAPLPVATPESAREKFGGAVFAQVAKKIGAQKLGYNVTVLPPGKRAFPFHS